MNINEISKFENEFILKSSQRYGKYYKNAVDALELLDESIKSIDISEFVFHSFYFQIKKSLQLALLSMLRLHEIQASMMMRYAVESSTMAAYSLYKTNTNNYLYTDEYGRATLKSKTQKKCYAWLETNYPTHSASIENKKKMLNMFSTHSNLFNTFKNIEINDFSYSLFDVIKDDDEIYVFLWNIANTTIFIMDMLEDVSKVILLYSSQNHIAEA